MKQHEREYFISRIRSGVYTIKNQGLVLKIYQPTIEQEFELNQVYYDAYQQAIEDDFMTQDQMLEWMREKELWTPEDDDKLEGLKQDIERLKVEIYNAKNNEQLRDRIRLYIRAGEKQYAKLILKQSIYYENTCEGIASGEKSFAFIKMCTYLGKEIYDFNFLPCETVWQLYNDQLLDEKVIRDLARNEPWRTLWIMSDANCFKLFANQNTELSHDQRALILWSRTYDNIQESMECPTQEVIDDDDMLDGWFIIQRKKREKQQAESELENTIKNDKIKNAHEVFIVAGSKKDAQKIDNMNDINGKMIKKQRDSLIKQKGVVSQADFVDERIRMSNQSIQMFKGNVGR